MEVSHESTRKSLYHAIGVVVAVQRPRVDGRRTGGYPPANGNLAETVRDQTEGTRNQAGTGRGPGPAEPERAIRDKQRSANRRHGALPCHNTGNAGRQ